VLEPLGDEVETEPSTGHGDRQPAATDHEGDDEQDRDRQEDAVLHERPDHDVKDIRPRVDELEDGTFADKQPVAGTKPRRGDHHQPRPHDDEIERSHVASAH
jgi:hypothetical protein